MLSEHFVPMVPFASRLRLRADELGISNAEVARRAGLSERRYAHYVSGKRSPTCDARSDRTGPGHDPNVLLGFEGDADQPATRGSLLKDRLQAAANALTEPALHMTVVQAEALAALATSGRE